MVGMQTIRRPGNVSLALVLVSLAACGRTVTTAPAPRPASSVPAAQVASAGPSVATPVAASAPVPSAKASAAARAPAPGASVALPPSPEVIMSMFTVGKQTKFALSDEVDTHSTSNDGPAHSGGAATLRVESTHLVGTVIVAELSWTMPEDFTWVMPPSRWALHNGAVYTLDGPFGPDHVVTDAAEIPSLLLKLKPVLTASDAKRASTGPAACHDVEEPGNYGPQLARVCLDRQGITSWTEVNRSGPRVLELKRVR